MLSTSSPLLRTASAAVKNPAILTYAIPSDIDSLDPAWIYDGLSHAIQIHLYETLVFYKGSSTEELEPMLASVVPSRANGLISKDGLSYTFPIRKNVKFHDGTQMTLEDVRYSILRFLLMDRAGGPSLLLLEPILGVESALGEGGKPLPNLFKEAERAVSVDKGNLVIKLKKPCAPLLSILANYSPIVSKATVIGNGGWDGTEATWTSHHNPTKQATGLHDLANGTGPFQLERWDKGAKQVILRRNELYWRQPARLANLVFKTVPESSTRKLLLQAGDADMAIIDRQFLPQVTGLAGVAVTDDLPLLETHNCFIMTFKTNPTANPYIGSGKLDGKGIPPDFFSDINVRKGLAYAFDYDAYIRDGYRGKGQRARGPIPRGIFGYNPKQEVRSHDLKKAEEYLRKAWGGQVWEKGFLFTLGFMEGRSDRQLAGQILKKMLESLNPRFKVEVRGIQWSTYLDHHQSGKLPIVNARWGLDFADPHNAVHPFLHSAGNYSKAAGYRNPSADALIEAAWREPNKEKRRKLYYELQEIAYEDVPTIFTLDTYNLRVTRDWVKSLDYNAITPYGYFYPAYKAP